MFFKENMNPNVWGAHYWFFLHAVARHYPVHPSSIHRKIHYRLIMNFHEFIPEKEAAKLFSALVKDNPISPYLDSRRDFMIWTNHIHNLVNLKLDKDEVSFDEYENTFEEHYKPARFQHKKRKESKLLIYGAFMVLLVIVAVCMK